MITAICAAIAAAILTLALASYCILKDEGRWREWYWALFPLLPIVWFVWEYCASVKSLWDNQKGL